MYTRQQDLTEVIEITNSVAEKHFWIHLSLIHLD